MRTLITHALWSVATLCFAGLATPALANHRHPLTEAAAQYRDHVQHFERYVHKLRYLERFDVRLVERLENAACDFFGATHRIDDPSRLLYHWNEIQSLQPRVTDALFGRACYPVNPELEACWREVLQSYECVERELRCLSHAPVFGGPTVSHPSVSHRAPIGVPHHAHRPQHDWLGEPSPFPVDRFNTRRVAPIGASPFGQPRFGHPQFGHPQFGHPLGQRAIAVPPIGGHNLNPGFGNTRSVGSELGAAVIGSLLNRFLSR